MNSYNNNQLGWYSNFVLLFFLFLTKIMMIVLLYNNYHMCRRVVDSFGFEN